MTPGPDLDRIADTLARLRAECSTGCDRFHAQVHDAILAAERAVKDWQAEKAAAA